MANQTKKIKINKFHAITKSNPIITIYKKGSHASTLHATSIVKFPNTSMKGKQTYNHNAKCKVTAVSQVTLLKKAKCYAVFLNIVKIISKGALTISRDLLIKYSIL